MLAHRMGRASDHRPVVTQRLGRTGPEMAGSAVKDRVVYPLQKWVANSVGAENLCHQVIFVEDSAGTVTPPDPEMIQISNAVGQRAQRRGLVQGSVRPVRVVEVLVLAQHGHQVALVPYQGPAQ